MRIYLKCHQEDGPGFCAIDFNEKQARWLFAKHAKVVSLLENDDHISGVVLHGVYPKFFEDSEAALEEYLPEALFQKLEDEEYLAVPFTFEKPPFQGVGVDGVTMSMDLEWVYWRGWYGELEVYTGSIKLSVIRDELKKRRIIP